MDERQISFHQLHLVISVRENYSPDNILLRSFYYRHIGVFVFGCRPFDVFVIVWRGGQDGDFIIFDGVGHKASHYRGAVWRVHRMPDVHLHICWLRDYK